MFPSNLYSPGFKILIFCLCFPIFVAGMLGNVLVLCVVVKQRGMRSTTNIFISQLAAADIIILTFCMPFTVTSIYFTEDWVFGAGMCQMVMFMQVFAVLLSTFTLLAMSAERYLVLLHPLKARSSWTRRRAVYCCVLVAVVAAGCSLPRPLLAGMLHYPDGMAWGREEVTPTTQSSLLTTGYTSIQEPVPVLMCFEDLPSEFLKYYNPLRVALFYVLPLIIMGFIYLCIARRVRQSGSQSAAGAGGVHDERRQKRSSRVSRMLVAMVLVFFISWLPYHAFLLAQALDSSRELFRQEWFMKALVATSALMYFSCICNPILYTFMSSQYRQGFRQLLCCCSSTERRRSIHWQQSSSSKNQSSTRSTENTQQTSANNQINSRSTQGHMSNQGQSSVQGHISDQGQSSSKYEISCQGQDESYLQGQSSLQGQLSASERSEQHSLPGQTSADGERSVQDQSSSKDQYADQDGSHKSDQSQHSLQGEGQCERKDYMTCF